MLQAAVATPLVEALRCPDTQVQEPALAGLRNWRAMREGLESDAAETLDPQDIWESYLGGDEPQAWAAWVCSQQP